MGDNLKKNMIGAIAWSSVNIFGIQFIQLIVGIILARILLPEDFGLIGVIYIFIGFSTVLIDAGFGQGLIRKQDATTTDFSTVFILNILISVLMYLLLYVSAPFIASFFSQPELIKLSRIIFICVLLYPLYQIQLVLLYKKLDYKSISIVNIISISISGIIATILALNHFGVWSLVYQQLSFHFIKVIVFPFFLKWKPSLSFSFNTVRNLWKFTVPIMSQGLLNVIFNQIYIVIIGRFYPLKQVGYFTQANKYNETVNVATQGIINSSTFPLLSKIQDDKERSLRIYRKLISSTAAITFPLSLFLFIAAEPVIITLISEKWINSVVFLQLLLLGNIFTPLFAINTNILNAQGLSSITLKLEVLKKSLILISIVGSFRFGINNMLIGFIIANIIAYSFSMVYIKKTLRHFYKHQLSDFLYYLILAFVVGGLSYSINFIPLHATLKLLLLLIVFITLYISGLRLFFKNSYYILRDTITNKLKNIF
ncbi:MAG: lipopolysaccharide biosynthesis protein [Paludibacter sp.]|nr:lipopolysaccharide biosynthesis protein [Paludibacter sp.]